MEVQRGNRPLGERAEQLLREYRGELTSYDLYLIRLIAQDSDSPIEELFATAYVMTVLSRGQLGTTLKWGEIADIDGLMTDEYRVIPYRPFTMDRADVIRQQLQMPEGRVDFGILRFEKNFQIPKSPLYRSKLVLVECDGHDFHERTPEQAERDRSRDRSFQASGHTVFRFTGRELWRDPLACARQVDEFLRSTGCGYPRE